MLVCKGCPGKYVLLPRFRTTVVFVAAATSEVASSIAAFVIQLGLPLELCEANMHTLVRYDVFRSCFESNEGWQLQKMSDIVHKYFKPNTT